MRGGAGLFSYGFKEPSGFVVGEKKNHFCVVFLAYLSPVLKLIFDSLLNVHWMCAVGVLSIGQLRTTELPNSAFDINLSNFRSKAATKKKQNTNECVTIFGLNDWPYCFVHRQKLTGCFHM